MADPELVLKTKVEIFKAVLALDPKAPVFVELAEALIEDGKPEEAAQVCRRGLEHHPDLLAGWVTLIEALVSSGRTEEAQQAISQAKLQAVAASQSLEKLARLEERYGSREELEPSDLEDVPALLTEGDEKEAMDIASPTLANLYLRQGLPAAAVKVYKRLLAKDPSNKAIRARLASMGEPMPVSAKGRLLSLLLKWQMLVKAPEAGRRT